MTKRKLKVLRALIQYPEGLYGSDLVRIIPGWFVRMWIYDTLEALATAGLIFEVIEFAQTPELLPRTRHVITPAGRAIVVEAHG